MHCHTALHKGLVQTLHVKITQRILKTTDEHYILYHSMSSLHHYFQFSIDVSQLPIYSTD